jgi:16S rRNA (uracil1498-N3)-methyltransferase
MKPPPRLFSAASLAADCEIALPREQAHYLVDVLRLRAGDPLRLFNATDGEWLCYLTGAAKKSATVRCERRAAEVIPPPDIDFLFAPLKHARLDYLVQKAVELGARRLRPVLTARTIVERVNLDRMRANAIEAAEQCNQVFVPAVLEPERLERLLDGWEAGRALIHCDETAAAMDPIAALSGLRPPAAVLVGPEGGFTEAERSELRRRPFVTVISLGPRIMRADTAGMAAMILAQALIGDWALRK